MKLGNIGQLTLVNGNLHLEVDVAVAGTVEAPLSADVQLIELLNMVQAQVTNNMEKMALGLVISLLSGVNLQAAPPSLEALPPWLEALLEALPSIIQAIIGGMRMAPTMGVDDPVVAKLQLALKVLQS